MIPIEFVITLFVVAVACYIAGRWDRAQIARAIEAKADKGSFDTVLRVVEGNSKIASDRITEVERGIEFMFQITKQERETPPQHEQEGFSKLTEMMKDFHGKILNDKPHNPGIAPQTAPARPT